MTAKRPLGAFPRGTTSDVVPRFIFEPLVQRLQIDQKARRIGVCSLAYSQQTKLLQPLQSRLVLGWRDTRTERQELQSGRTPLCSRSPKIRDCHHSTQKLNSFLPG